METFAESAPEKVLANVLQRHGHQVKTYSVRSFPDQDVDMFHVHHFSPAAYYLALAKKKPIIFTSHSGFLISDFPFPDSRLERFMRKLVFRQADRVIALSQNEALILEKKYKVKKDKIHIIHNALDLKLYPSPDPFSNGEPSSFSLLSVGQLDHHKGHRYLLEAMVEIVKRHPEVHLRIITHNPKLLKEYLSFCTAHDLEDHVVIESAKKTKDLIEDYRNCDIYVQPSLVESFGITITEAMACGRPVVATDVGGVRENVGDEAGILVPPKNSKELAKAIVTLIENPELRHKLGTKGRLRTESLFNDELFYEKHIQIYKQTLQHWTKGFHLPDWTSRMMVSAYIHRGKISWIKRALFQGRKQKD